MAISVSVQVMGLYYFCSVNSMGFDGVCLANGLMYFSRFIATIILVKYGGDIQSFTDVSFFSYETMSNVWSTLNFGM